MPKYSFSCPNGHLYEAWAPSDDIWAECPEHGVPGPRDLYADLQTIVAVCDDPIRKSWLSSQIDRNLAEQGRPLDPLAPKDKFDARNIEKATGRIAIGDDISHMRPISQRAILNGSRNRGESKPQL